MNKVTAQELMSKTGNEFWQTLEASKWGGVVNVPTARGMKEKLRQEIQIRRESRVHWTYKHTPQAWGNVHFDVTVNGVAIERYTGIIEEVKYFTERIPVDTEMEGDTWTVHVYAPEGVDIQTGGSSWQGYTRKIRNSAVIV